MALENIIKSSSYFLYGEIYYSLCVLIKLSGRLRICDSIQSDTRLTMSFADKVKKKTNYMLNLV